VALMDARKKVGKITKGGTGLVREGTMPTECPPETMAKHKKNPTIQKNDFGVTKDDSFRMEKRFKTGERT